MMLPFVWTRSTVCSASIITRSNTALPSTVRFLASRLKIIIFAQGSIFPKTPTKSLPQDYLARAGACPLAESAVPALSLLKGAGVQQVILSASNLPVLEQQVTERGVRPYFDRLLGLDNIYARSKVEVGLAYLTELKQRGAVPAQAIMIGDSVHDFEVAQALGVRCVLQTAGHQSAQQLRATGAPVVPDVLAAAQYCLNEL